MTPRSQLARRRTFLKGTVAFTLALVCPIKKTALATGGDIIIERNGKYLLNASPYACYGSDCCVCVEVCPANAISFDSEDRRVVDIGKCATEFPGCGAECAEVCPAGSLERAGF